MAEFSIKVTPRAKRVGLKLDGENIRAYVSAPPEDGKANKELVRLIAKTLGVARSAISIIRGKKSRDKIVSIIGVSEDEFRGKLGENAKLLE